jgi:hypothetical protein
MKVHYFRKESTTCSARMFSYYNVLGVALVNHPPHGAPYVGAARFTRNVADAGYDYETLVASLLDAGFEAWAREDN